MYTRCVHSQFQAQKNEEVYGRLKASLKFSHSIMNGSTIDVTDLDYSIKDP